MKAAVITRHAITNYGSLLQALATQKLIESLGWDCEIIDYIKQEDDYHYSEKVYLARKPNWNSNWLTRSIYLGLRYIPSIVAGRHFELMRNGCLNLTKRYDSLAKICEKPPTADVYITGSDQVWGPLTDGKLDSAYCLSFAGNHHRVAFASSFGAAELSDERMAFFKGYLSRYEFISVREDSAKSIVAGLGLKSEQVLDPTLAVDPSVWREIAQKGKTERYPYILIYQVHNSKEVYRYAKEIAKSTGYRIIRASALLHQITYGGHFKYAPSLEDFLALFRSASYVVTDSFHGTAFSIIFERQFVEVLPDNATKTRNESLLRVFGLQNRIALEGGGVSKMLYPIDYSAVDVKMGHERAKTASLLIGALNAVEKTEV